MLTPLADSIQKLKEYDQDSPSWLMQRLKHHHNETMKKIPLQALRQAWSDIVHLSPLTATNTVENTPKFQNMRQAVADYIREHNVPLQMFTDAEKAYLFPEGIPAPNPSATPESAPDLSK